MKVGDKFDCKVTHVGSLCTVEHRIEPSDLTGKSLVQVAFTADMVGKYCVEMSVNERTVAGGPTHRRFVGGPLDVTTSELAVNTARPLIVTKDAFLTIKLLAKDSFGNPTTLYENLCRVKIKKASEKN